MLLELRNIKKYFPIKHSSWHAAKDYVRAVDGLDLDIKKGENISLVGESGCGKTTLGRLILKLLPLTSGEIIFDNQDISQLSDKKMRLYRKDLQMVFQDPYSSLDPRFTIRNVIKEAMSAGEKKRQNEIEERIRELLSLVALPVDILDRFPHEFSGGERQRIAIARALATNPKLLILDEAVSSLDVLVQNQIVRLLLDLQSKIDVTYLFISHNLRIVRKISSKIAVMYKGKIVELVSSQELFSNPLHPYTKELLSAALAYKAVKRTEDIAVPKDSKLIDRGNGHFVIE